MVRYCYENGTATAAKITFEAAVQQVAAQIPCLKFQHVNATDNQTCSELPSIMVRSQGSGCWAHVGQVSNSSERLMNRSQLLNLGTGCHLPGMAVHQLAHALGRVHETSHVDRSRYLRVVEANTNEPTLLANNSKNQASARRPLDFLSVMMYPAHAFSRNGRATLEPLAEPLLGRYLGQRMGVSELDVSHFAQMYGCGADAKPATRTKDLSELFLSGKGMAFDGSCVDSSYTGMEYVDGQNITRPFACPDLRDKCHDAATGKSVRQVCPLTCLVCVAAPADTVAAASTTSSTATTTTPATVRTCIDVADTGIRFRNGAKASCSDLTNYCNHAKLGDKVKAACVKTCGRCTLASDDFAAQGATVACFDQPADALPVLTVAGKPGECSQLRSFCQGHPDSEYVVRKCPVSCGFCDRAGGSPTTTTASGAATTTYTFSTSSEDSAKGMGCSRRRRWGFCNTRRRRLQ